MWSAVVRAESHYYSIEEVAEQDHQRAAYWPNAEPGCKAVEKQQGTQSPVASQKPQANPWSPVLASSVLHHGAVPDFLCELGVGEMIATESANKIFPGAEHIQLSSKLGRAKFNHQHSLTN